MDLKVVLVPVVGLMVVEDLEKVMGLVIKLVLDLVGGGGGVEIGGGICGNAVAALLVGLEMEEVVVVMDLVVKLVVY
ncbi:unnamed protein product [Dovyalis caffra]|uniref:Uncharacterized protein n=1 Tax=Dovyalis caffra TaxID=77055 RepID=A0AAV1R3Q4_9ROSI|nr:unnamed protein product [Dovyalis caffra]